jgi:hypothetical protein
MSLKDTLATLQQQEQQKAQWERDKPNVIKEWQESVGHLLKEIRGYLSDYESDGSMIFSDREVELSEEMLGQYRVPAMSIVAGPAIIMVDPVGRMIIGAQGRVDMYRQGRGREQDRVVLLRVRTSPTDPTPLWATSPPPEIGTPSGKVRGRSVPQQRQRPLVPLNKEILEQRLDFMLR